MGAQVILNIFIIGIWLAAGGGYFWPAWVMLGSAIAVGLNALPRPARAHRSLLGDYSAPLVEVVGLAIGPTPRLLKPRLS